MDSLLVPVALASLALSPAPAARIQEPGPTAIAPEEDVHEQMLRLIARIESTLRRVDDLLWDVHGPAKREEEPRSAGELLVSARNGARRAVEDIDELLELIHHPHPPGGT